MKKWLLLLPTLFNSLNTEAKLLDGIRAVVQDKAILYSDVTERISSVKASPALASILNVSVANFDDTAALNLLIEEKLILVAAKEIGAEPTEAEISKQIGVIASQNRLSVENLKKSLQVEKIDYTMYKENIALQLAKRAVIEKELRSSTSSMSDQELLNYYERNTPDEVLLSMIKSGPQQSASLKSLRAQILKSGKVADTTLRNTGAVDLGWNDPSTLNEAFQQAIAQVGKTSPVTGVFTHEAALYLLVIRGRRSGSGGNFEKSKEQLRQQLQAKDVEERFKSWLEQKKKTINVVVNEG